MAFKHSTVRISKGSEFIVFDVCAFKLTGIILGFYDECKGCLYRKVWNRPAQYCLIRVDAIFDCEFLLYLIDFPLVNEISKDFGEITRV